MGFHWSTLLVVVILGSPWLFVSLSKLLKHIWWKPLRARRVLEAQGVKGPPSKLIFGNLLDIKEMLQEVSYTSTKSVSHDIVPWIFPYYTRWSKIYGGTFLVWWGIEPRLTISDPDLIKEILITKVGYFPKPAVTPASKDLWGDGLVTSNGKKWARERRLLNQAFHADRLKDMVETMSSLTLKMLDHWRSMLTDSKNSFRTEIEVQAQFANLSADIIARTAFGTSYEAGKVVFKLQYEQRKLAVEAYNSLRWPGQSFLPTPRNLYRWKIKKQIEEKLRQIIRTRLTTVSKTELRNTKDDLLGLMISALRGNTQERNIDYQTHQEMSIQNIVDQCKTFFFAGHETTAALLTWTTMLLAINPHWQERLRTELSEVCQSISQPPDADMLNRLRQMTMVLQEALRLYPAGIMLLRYTSEDTKLENNLLIPKGTTLMLPALALMHSKEMWGEDASEFRPERFIDGIANAAKKAWAFMPFSLGPRNCIAQGFALMEAKIVLSLILQRFRLELSPRYVHAPSQSGIISPLFGMQILVRPIET